MERDFEIIKLPGTGDRGILKTVGDREVVVSIKLIQGADSADNEWLSEAIRNVYMQYYSRVSEYITPKGDRT